MVYQWKTNSRIKVNADVAGVMFEHLEQSVGLTPETLLDANRDESAPLHSEFEWDDTVAAEEYRLVQARYLIRMLCVKPEVEQAEKKPVRAFFKVSSEGYESLPVIVQDKDKHQALLDQAIKELTSFRRKYVMLKELEPIFKQIDEVIA